jgi:hypothetical protein
MQLLDITNRLEKIGFHLHASNGGKVDIVPINNKARAMLKDEKVKGVNVALLPQITNLLEMGVNDEV